MIREARADLELALKAVTLAGQPVPVVSSDTLEPPALNVVERDPFVVEGGSTFEHPYLIQFDVVASVRAGDTSVMVDQLDELVDSVLVALVDTEWAVEVQGYRPMSYDGQPVLTCTIHATTEP